MKKRPKIKVHGTTHSSNQSSITSHNAEKFEMHRIIKTADASGMNLTLPKAMAVQTDTHFKNEYSLFSANGG